MTAASDAYALCHCGHVQAHHAVVDLLYGNDRPWCQWRGCGCPRFLAPEESPAAPPGQPQVIRVCGCADHPCTCMRSGGSLTARGDAEAQR